jgi:hypothetical protein
MDLLAEEEGGKRLAVLQEAEAENAVLPQLHYSSLAVVVVAVAVAGVAIDMEDFEEAVIGSGTAMTALGAHTGSVAGVAGTQAEIEIEEVRCYARMAAMSQYSLVEVKHCFARAAGE